MSRELSLDEREALLDECRAIRADLDDLDDEQREPIKKRLAAAEKALQQGGRKGRATQTDGVGAQTLSGSFVADTL